jgi:hypothetical protein
LRWRSLVGRAGVCVQGHPWGGNVTEYRHQCPSQAVKSTKEALKNN